MKGCRPLTDEEIAAVLGVLSQGRQAARNRALFILGIRTGYRISELLSLRVANVYRNGQVTFQVTVAKRNMKGNREGRALPLHAEARGALLPLVEMLLKRGPDSQFLFQSRNGLNQKLHRGSAWEMLCKAFDACGLTGKLASHSMRKTFARRMRTALGGDLYKLQKLMGHTDIRATIKYLDIDDDELDAAVLKS